MTVISSTSESGTNITRPTRTSSCARVSGRLTSSSRSARVWRRDLNGDGKIEMGTDQLTYLYEIVPSGTFQTSLQLDVVTLDENGIPQYLGLTEKFVDAFDTMQNFLKQDGIVQAKLYR